MAQRQNETDWAQQVPEHRYRGDYDDYGWESGESVLPEFRDPSVHEMPYERRRDWRAGTSQGARTPGYDFDWVPAREYGRTPPQQGRRTGLRAQAPWTIPGPHTGKGPHNYRRSDERIREDVCDRLSQHGQLDASEIEVSVKMGVVTLQGTVDSRRDKRMAEDIADSVLGVEDVQNELRLGESRQTQ